MGQSGRRRESFIILEAEDDTVAVEASGALKHTFICCPFAEPNKVFILTWGINANSSFNVSARLFEPRFFSGGDLFGAG